MMREYAARMSDLVLRLYELCQERQTSFAAKYGVRVAEFRCLRILLRNDTVPIKDLAAGMHLTPGRLTRIVDELKKKGYVNREEPETDRRMKIISLTEEGRRLAQRMDEEYNEMHAEILSFLDGHDIAQVMDVLEKLIDAMEKWQDAKVEKVGAA